MLWSGRFSGSREDHVDTELSIWSVHVLALSPALERSNVGERMGIVASAEGEKKTHAKIDQ